MIVQARLRPDILVEVRGVRKAELTKLKKILKYVKEQGWEQLRSAKSAVISIEIRARTSDDVLGRRRGTQCYVFRRANNRTVDFWGVLCQELLRVHQDFVMTDARQVLTETKAARPQRRRRVRPPVRLGGTFYKPFSIEETWHLEKAAA